MNICQKQKISENINIIIGDDIISMSTSNAKIVFNKLKL